MSVGREIGPLEVEQAESSRAELEAADPRDDGGIEEALFGWALDGGRHDQTPRPLFGGGTASSRRATTPSEVTCSDSA